MSTQFPRAMPIATVAGYEQDLYQWALQNTRLLRQGRLGEIDVANIADELEAMGRTERRSLKSHLRVLLLHLLKWQFQPTLHRPSWRRSIRNARDRIEDILEESPSLELQIPPSLLKEYDRARRHAVDETGLVAETFPTTCPYSHEELRDADFLPGDPRGGSAGQPPGR